MDGAAKESKELLGISGNKIMIMTIIKSTNDFFVVQGQYERLSSGWQGDGGGQKWGDTSLSPSPTLH